MDANILNQIKADIPDKACLITIMFVPANDQQAIEVKAKIDAALEGMDIKRYSFSLEQRTATPKPTVT